MIQLAEEDYVLSALGWAATKNLPILFVVEDNNLSILTEKKVRRVWEMDDVHVDWVWSLITLKIIH